MKNISNKKHEYDDETERQLVHEIRTIGMTN